LFFTFTALLAGISIGEYKNFKEAAACAVNQKGEFLPDTSMVKEYKKRYDIYKLIYSTNKYLLHKISKLSS